ncbi:MAG: SAM-dependent methyltransferase [Candidatus Thermoplasmatota archaeon]
MTLAQRLHARIVADGPITVRDFMDAALYDADEGYYSKGPRIGGEGADFYTASNVSLFPNALGRFVKAAVERMGGVARVVELGAGEGDLAKRLGFEITVVEVSAGLAKKQEAMGLQVVRGLDELREAPTIFIANEVLDALPVHRVVMAVSGLRELYVDASFREVEGALSPALDTAARRLAWLPIGARAEVNLAARELLVAMARAGPKSLALFLDYGARQSERLYGEHAMDGTLRGFRAHKVTPPLERPGEQDITADVDFSWIATLAAEAGYASAGIMLQGEFLADLGLVDDLQAALARGDMQAYLAGKNLLMPTGMGERFQALLLARDVHADPPLPGFRKDIYPGASRR